MNVILHLGLDVHNDSIAVSLAPSDSTEVRRWGILGGTHEHVQKFIKQLQAAHPDATLRFCYEAGPRGFPLCRFLRGLGHECLLVCPSRVPRAPGGRVLKAGTRKVTNRIANILRMAANALSRAHGPMGEYVRRFKGRLGKAEGIVAGAHKLARILWAMIVSGEPYDEKKAFAITEASTARRLKNLQHQAKALNMTLVPNQ